MYTAVGKTTPLSFLSVACPQEKWHRRAKLQEGWGCAWSPAGDQPAVPILKRISNRQRHSQLDGVEGWMLCQPDKNPR